MIIIIKKNPQALQQLNDLQGLINSLIKGRFWQKSGTLKSLRIIEVVGQKNTLAEYHLICEVVPVEVTKRVVGKLNGRDFFGVPLIAREYVIRDYANDPRQNKDNTLRSNSEKRRSERRRSKFTTRSVQT